MRGARISHMNLFGDIETARAHWRILTRTFSRFPASCWCGRCAAVIVRKSGRITKATKRGIIGNRRDWRRGDQMIFAFYHFSASINRFDVKQNCRWVAIIIIFMELKFIRDKIGFHRVKITSSQHHLRRACGRGVAKHCRAIRIIFICGALETEPFV